MRAATAAIAAAPACTAAAVGRAPRRWVTIAATAGKERHTHAAAAAPAAAAAVRSVGIKLEANGGASQGIVGLLDSSVHLSKQVPSHYSVGVPRASSTNGSSSSRTSTITARAFQSLLLNVHDVAQAPPGRLSATAKAAASQRQLNCELWSAVCRRTVSLEKAFRARDAASLLAAAAAAQRLLLESKKHQPPQQHQQLLLQHKRMTQAAAAALSRALLRHQQQQQAVTKLQQHQQQQQPQAITPTVLTTALHAFAALELKDNELLQQLAAAAVSLHLHSFSGYDLTSFCCSLVTAVRQQQQQEQQHSIQQLSSFSLQLETLLLQHLAGRNAASYETLVGLQHQLTCALAYLRDQQQQQPQATSAGGQEIADGVLLLLHEEPRAVAAAWDRPPHRQQASLAALLRAVIELRIHRSQPLLLPLLLQAALLQLEEARARLALRGLKRFLEKTLSTNKLGPPMRAAVAAAAAAAADVDAAVVEETEVRPLELLLCLSTCRDLAGLASCLSLLQQSDVESLNAALHQLQLQQQQQQLRQRGLASTSLAVSLPLYRIACTGLLHGPIMRAHAITAAPTEAAAEAAEAAEAVAPEAATAACAETWVSAAATHAAEALDAAPPIKRLLLLAADHASLIISLSPSSNEEYSSSSSSSSRRDTEGAHEFVSAAKIASSCNKLSLCGSAASTAAGAAAAAPALEMPHLPLAALLQLKLQQHWAVLSVDQLAMCWRLYSQTAAACASAAQLQKQLPHSALAAWGPPVSQGLMLACSREVGLMLLSLAVEPLRVGLAARLRSAGLSHLSTCLEAVASCSTSLSGEGALTSLSHSLRAPGPLLGGTGGLPVALAPLLPHLALVLKETAETLTQSLLQQLQQRQEQEQECIEAQSQQQHKGVRRQSSEKELSSLGQLVAAVAALERLAPASAAAAVAAVARHLQQKSATRSPELSLQQCGVLLRALAKFQLRDAEMLAYLCGRLTGLLQQLQHSGSGVSGQLLSQLLLSLSQLSFTPAHIAQARGVHTPRQEAACAALFDALQLLLQQTQQQQLLVRSMGLQSTVNCLHALALCDFSWRPSTCESQEPVLSFDPQPAASAAAGAPVAAASVGEQSILGEEGSRGGGSTMPELFNLLLNITRKHLLPMLHQQQQEQPRQQPEGGQQQSNVPNWRDLKSVLARLPAAQQQLTAAATAAAAPRHQSLRDALQQENQKFLSVLEQHVCCLEPCSSSSSSSRSSSSNRGTKLRGPPKWLLVGTRSDNAARTPHLARSALQRGVFAALQRVLPVSPLFVELVAVEADGGSHFLYDCELPQPQVLQQQQQQKQEQQLLQRQQKPQLWASDMHGNVYNSSTLLKHRLLQESGLPVVSVSAAEWKAASGGRAGSHEKLLLQKLQRCLSSFHGRAPLPAALAPSSTPAAAAVGKRTS
ncbi:hypothetical protein Esti_001900 [Eimeria stiedai]